ncbi:MAG: hypothetical protein OXF01_12650 [Gemmatimonadetes bacterium]|nr:hypothetical protein [Gemmatimonadota bacterium]
MRAHEIRTDRAQRFDWRVFTLLLSLVLVGAPRALAQQVLEVDYDTERVVIDDPFYRSFALDMLAIDHARGILYVEDREEPEGVMSFSLLTGERLNVVRYAKGGGPNELPQNKAGFALAPGGNLFVADPSKVLELDPLGEVVSYWLPRAPTRLGICSFGGEPAVPTVGGVVRRNPDGPDLGIGSNALVGESVSANSFEEGRAIAVRTWRARVACNEEAAFVVESFEDEADSVYVYYLDGREDGRLAIPAVSTRRWGISCGLTIAGVRIRRGGRCPEWNEMLRPSLDENGNLVLVSTRGLRLPMTGVIVDPESGCHALLRHRPQPGSDVVATYADSAVVFHKETVPTERGVSIGANAGRVTLNPLRRVSGEPCADMVPSVSGQP